MRYYVRAMDSDGQPISGTAVRLRCPGAPNARTNRGSNQIPAVRLPPISTSTNSNDSSNDGSSGTLETIAKTAGTTPSPCSTILSSYPSDLRMSTATYNSALALEASANMASIGMDPSDSTEFISPMPTAVECSTSKAHPSASTSLSTHLTKLFSKPFGRAGKDALTHPAQTIWAKPEIAKSDSTITISDGYHDRVTSLPENWEAARTADGRTYYIDHNTRTTTWVDPRSIDLFTRYHAKDERGNVVSLVLAPRAPAGLLAGLLAGQRSSVGSMENGPSKHRQEATPGNVFQREFAYVAKLQTVSLVLTACLLDHRGSEACRREDPQGTWRMAGFAIVKDHG
ncbi:hypothetical protein BC831DRAFT_62827 [Entophlyctis helioformis]|nr:hypothetical protein BC831DRAFT_62827 [Entophlyctis helioformis]